MKKLFAWMGLLVVVGFAGSIFAVDAVNLDQVVFSENFDSYTVGNQLPAGENWSKISAKRSIGCSVLIQADDKNIFGEAGNQYLLMSDNSDKGTVRALAQDISGFSARVFRLSFDLFEPDDGKDGSFGVKVGVEGVSKSDQTVVNGVQFADGKSRPGLSYSLGMKHHFDLFINETADSISYLAPDGKERKLKIGNCSVWINGECSAKGADMHRALKESVPATSLMLSSYSSAKQEVWFDNIEIAVAQ